jgi:hypothetical protein
MKYGRAIEIVQVERTVWHRSATFEILGTAGMVGDSNDLDFLFENSINNVEGIFQQHEAPAICLCNGVACGVFCNSLNRSLDFVPEA